MSIRRSPALLVLLLSALAGAWFLRGGSETEDAGLSRAGQAGGDLGVRELASGGDEAGATDSPEVRVPASSAGGGQESVLGPLILSATGLPVSQVEVARPNSPWELTALVQGHLPTEVEPRGLRVRCDGHLAAAVGEGDEVVELQPAASLTLRGAGARQRLTGVRLAADRPEPDRWLFAGTRRADFVDDDTWVMALVPDDRWRELLCLFELDGESHLRVELLPRRGARIELELPESAGPLEHLPLEVQVRGATSKVVLSVDADERLARGQVRGPDGEYLARWTHELDPETLELESEDGTFQLRGYPRGRRFYLRARAPAEGSEVGHTFESDGVPIVLELRGGRVVRGRLVAAGRSLPSTVDVAWRFGRSDGSQPKRLARQGQAARGVPVDEVGRFVVGVPDDPVWVGFAEGPDRLTLDLHAAGFESLEVEVRLEGGARDHDLGALALDPRTPEFVLLPPHPVLKRPLLEGQQDASVLCSPSTPEVRHWVSFVAEAELDQGSRFEVFLQCMPGGNGRPRYEVGRLRCSWEEIELPTPPRLVLMQAGVAYPYERTASGAYQGVECRLREVELSLGALPEGATRVELAWVWRGLEVPIDRFGAGDLKPSDVGDVVRFPVWAPRDSAGLSIQYASNNPNDGAPLLVGEARLEPLVGDTLRLSLP